MGFDLLADAIHASQWLAAFRGFSQAAAPMVVTALWQSAALACGLAICLRLAPRVSAAHRFAVWAAGFAAVAALPFLPLLLALHAEGSGNASGLAVAAPQPWLDLDIRWSLAIGALWLAASAARVVDLAVHSWRLRRLWKRATPVETSQPAGVLAAGLGAWGGRRVEVCTTQDLDRPSVIGFFRPRILIPEWLLGRLTDKELEQVVLHEAEHLRRRDDWTNLAQKVCLMLFPLNPALVWMERRLCREREMACDEGVVQVTQAPRAYAACLASLAERRAERRIARRAAELSLGAWRRRPELVERVHRILRRGRGLSPWMAKALVGSLGCGLVVGSVELARCPQLVAFVPEQRLTAQELAPAAPQLHRAAYFAEGRARRNEPSAEFRAVNTVAQMRMSGGDAARPGRFSARRAVMHPAHTAPGSAVAETASATPPEELLNAEMAKPHEQQWAVLTTWREVQTTAAWNDAAPMPVNQALSQASDQSFNQAPDQVSRQGGMEVSGQTVYQVIYQEARATDSAPAAAPGPTAAHGPDAAPAQPNAPQGSRITVTRLILRVYSTAPLSNSIPWQPGVFPIRNGWLVIQL